MRPRAGHGWTVIIRGKKHIHMIANSSGEWVSTGVAHSWLRCQRCRRPEEKFPFDSGLCSTCFFYKNGLSVDDFWKIHEQGYPLAPYNIGKKLMKTPHPQHKVVRSPLRSTA